MPRDPQFGDVAALEQLFLAQLELVDGVIAFVCRRHHLRAADAEDFASTAKLRLIENDYEIVGRFEGRSSFRTYLTVVILRFYLDFQVQRWGKWRPSAEARRLGPLAIRLESLLHRDRLSFDEACGVLETDWRVKESRDALEELRARLPPRMDRLSALRSSTSPPARPDGETAVEHSERQALAREVEQAIKEALGRLDPRSRLVLRLRFEEDLSVADIARSLREDQARLYRQIEKTLKDLQADLEGQGIRLEEVRQLLETVDWDLVLDTDRRVLP